MTDDFKAGAEAFRAALVAHFRARADEQKAAADKILARFHGSIPCHDGSGSESERYNRRRFSVQLNSIAAEISDFSFTDGDKP